MQLQFLGQSYDTGLATIAVNRPLQQGRYRGQTLHLTPEASELPAPNKAMTYRGASYLGR